MNSEIRLQRGTLDEVVGDGVSVHLEKMAPNHWFIEIDGIKVWLWSSRPITATFEDGRSSGIIRRMDVDDSRPERMEESR
jgi:hypothetical protein